VINNVSEECNALIFMALKGEAVTCSENVLPMYQVTQSYIPAGHNMHTNLRKFVILNTPFVFWNGTVLFFTFLQPLLFSSIASSFLFSVLLILCGGGGGGFLTPK